MANKKKVAMVFGALLGGWHAFWSLLVFLGVAQPLYDFVMWAHMIHLPLVIGPFDASAALTLVIFTSCVGYVLGWIGAWVWNYFHHHRR